METFGTWAATKGGIKQSYTMVTDYGPGHDSESAFQSAFKAAGGTIVGSVRFPVANPDFSAFVQRAKDMAPESIFIFIPGGAQPAALGKAFAERGIDLKKTRILGSGETTAEAALKSMGDNALGIITAWHYDYTSKAPLNQKFVKEYQGVANGRNPDFFSIGGYDGMHAIYEALKKTKGNTDAQALVDAAKGLKWDSPRGPMMIDPETRDVGPNVYIRRVEKVGNELVNVPFDTIPMVKDPAGGRGKKGAQKQPGARASLAAVLFDGFAYGMLLFLLSVGLSVTLGMMNFVNLAHCSFAMVGAYATFSLASKHGWPFLATLPMAFIAAALISLVLERTLYRRLYRATDLDQCLFTIGIVFISIAVYAWFYTTEQQSIQVPDWLKGAQHVGG